MKQIAIAMHVYHDEHYRFPPPAIYDKDGKPLLSWRVALLPLIEKGDLYQRFHLDEPWDSPHNIELLKEMPDIYRRPNASARHDEYKTLYQVPVGPGTIFGSKKIPSLIEIVEADGVSTTFLVVEAYEPVPWTKPEDLNFAPDQPLPELGGLNRNLGWRPFAQSSMNHYGFQAAFADGPAQYFPKVGNYWSTEANIRALATWNGGENVELP